MMSIRSKHLIPIVLLICLNILVLSVVLIHKRPTGKTYHIVLTENGFKPRDISIHKGDTIIFSTTIGKRFWPASNLHPTHELYPAFDPKMPIEPDKTWSFTFEKEGAWKFHDHLFPSYTGTIIVDAKKPTAETLESCRKRTNGQKQQCWETVLSQSLEQDGLDVSFTLFDKLYRSEPLFANDCHGYAHDLGKNAFLLYEKGRTFTIPEQATYCGYGFYHGFMENFLRRTEDIAKLGNFCRNIGKTETPILVDACYHGIGHGALTDTLEKNRFSEQDHITAALALCHKAASDTTAYQRCASGVFMELGNTYLARHPGFTLDTKQPLHICDLQAEEDKLSCYTQLNGIVNWITQSSIKDDGVLIDTIANRHYAEEAMITTIGNAVITSAKTPARSARDCQDVAYDLRTACIKGIALALLLTGESHTSARSALTFCSSVTLSSPDQEACMQYATSHLRNLFSHAEFTAVCHSLDERFRHLCS